MRKIVFLVSFIILVSCANNSPTADENSITEEAFLVKEYSTNSLVKEKFLEFYDLKVLLENKPEFKEVIAKRLASFKIDSNTILEISKNSKIKNFEITEPDSININAYSKLKIIFEIDDQITSKKDSLIVFIFEEYFTLDDEKVTSKKIKFTRFHK